MRRLALLVAAFGCAAPPSTTAPVVYVGQIDDGEEGASIALAMTPGRLVVYGCGDDATEDDYLGWAGMALAQGQSEIAVEVGGWAFEGFWDEREATGTLDRDDKSYAWWARPVTPGQLDGLYLRQGQSCATAVIVDGEAVRGTWWCDSGELAQVTPLFPLALVDGRLTVEFVVDNEARRVEVSPVRAPLP